MHNDPTDETHRKPRQLRNTPLLKYIRITSLVVALMYAGAMYISYRRNILPYIDDERYKLPNLKDDQEMRRDYAMNPYLRSTIDNLIEKRETKAKLEAESENTPSKD